VTTAVSPRGRDESGVAAPERVSFAGFTLDVAGHTLIDADGREVALRRSEFMLLLAFVGAPGQVLSRDYLLSRLAGRHPDPFDRAIDMRIGRLRGKIEADPKAPRLIRTVPGVGYKFAVTPHVVAAHPSAESELAADPPSPAQPRHAERRQMTVLRCGLDGYGALAAQLDPEDLQHVLAVWHECCADVIGKLGDSLVSRSGEEVVACFGYPMASEHAAERAVAAGISLVQTIAHLDAGAGAPLAARVALATGTVLVEPAANPGGLPRLVGEAPALAGALLAEAPTGGVIIAEATRSLVGDLFELRPCASGAVGGAPAFSVLGAAAVEDRFMATRAARLTPFVGREEELALLMRRWRQAASGAGRLVLLGAEPGMGKSRLVHELAKRMHGEPLTHLTCFCSPHHQDSAYHPIIGYLERAARFVRGDSREDRLAKLEAFCGPNKVQTIALFADLLSIPTEGKYPLPTVSPHQRRELTCVALVEHFVSATRRWPVLMVCEDAHWIDPTSRDVLDALIGRIGALPMLLVVTYRPEFSPPWSSLSLATTLVLTRLDSANVGTMVAAAGGAALPSALQEQIVSRAEGIPLFAEELTRTALEHGALAVPASLQDALMARLDRHPVAKRAAQLGAAIGRCFSHELVAAIAEEPATEIDHGLEALVASGLADCHGPMPDAVYTFKHALVRDATYGTVLRSDRSAIHGRIVDALTRQEPGIEQSQPGLLAHHCEQAGALERAAEYYLDAGWQNNYRAAYTESRAQFGNALRVARALPEGRARDYAEMRALRGFGLTMANAVGYGSSEFGEATSKAAALCERLGYPAEFSGIGFGRFVFQSFKSDLQGALQTAERLIEWGDSRRDVRGTILGHLCAGRARVAQGALLAARSDLEQALELYPRSLDDPAVIWSYRVATSGANLSNALRAHLGQVLAWLGYPDKALTHIRAIGQQRENEAVVIGEVWDLWRSLTVRLFLSDPAELLAPAEHIVKLSRDRGLPMFNALAGIIQGYATAHRGEPEKGKAIIEQGLAAYEATGAVSWLCYYRALLAETHQMLSETDEALRILKGSLRETMRTGERWYDAELHRRIGEIHRQRGEVGPARRSFGEALRIARGQSAKLWELRAATSLARMLRDCGNTEAAHAQLAPVYAWFSEGFDTVPLRQARALLDDLETR
jgi:class 3 adenylate cyclase/tetratricopeptide (TPR) repeat protein